MNRQLLKMALCLAVLLGCTVPAVYAQNNSNLSFGAIMRSVKVYIQQDDWQKARELLEQAVEKKPDDEEANYFLGYYWGLEGDYVKMSQYWDASLAHGKSKKKDIDRNRETYFRNNFNDGISLYNEAAELLADASAKEERDELLRDAVEGFRVAMVVKPDDLRPVKPMSKALMVLGETEEAEKLFIAVLEREPQDIGSLKGLGELYLKKYEADTTNKENLRKSVERYEQAMAVDPEDTELMRHVVAGYVELNELGKANVIFEQAVKKNPKDPDLRMAQAEMLAKQGKMEEAIKGFEEVIKLAPDNATPVVNVAAFLMENERFQDALPYWLKLTELLPTNWQVWNNLGVCYGRIGENDKAIAAVKKAEELKPKQ